MAKTEKPTATEAPPGRRELLPARLVDPRKAVTTGLASGAVSIFIAASGVFLEFNNTEVLTGVALGYLVLVGVPLVLGYLAAKPPPQLEGYKAAQPGVRNLAAGAITGALTGALVGLFLFVANSINIRPVFTNVSPQLVETLTLGGSGVGVVGGALHFIPDRWRRAIFMGILGVFAFALLEDLADTIFENTGAFYVTDFLYEGGVLSALGALIVFASFFGLSAVLHGRPLTMTAIMERFPERRRQPVRLAMGALIVLLVLALPPILERNY